MSEEPRTAAEGIEQDGTLNPVLSPVEGLSQEKARRTQMFRVFALVAGSGATVVLVLSFVIKLLVPQFPLQHIASVVVAFMLTSLLSFWLSRQGHLSLAIGVFIGSITVGLLAVSYFVNGASGPFVVALISVPVIAGLLAGRKAVRWVALSAGVLYVTMIVLEALGVLRPWEMSGLTLRAVHGGMFLLTLGITAFYVETFVDLSERALSTAQQRGRELAEASRQAQQAAQAEREAREREERATWQLRRAMQEYTTFLERVAAGDYSAMLTLDEAEKGREMSRELRTLGDHLNSTVETLVTALSGMQILQQRYLRDAWEGFAQTSAAHRGFRYHAPSTGPRDPSTPRYTLRQAQDEARDDAASGRGPSTGSGHGAVVEPDDEAWLAPMEEAVQDKDMTISARELALPITLRGQIIGAIGARRDEQTGWSDEDMALVTEITDQLAQTIESLRLLDETQRRAVRERLSGQVTARMRETLDVDTVLQTAVREIGQALGLAALDVRLGTETELTDG
jgi:GAF domain-containing protein